MNSSHSFISIVNTRHSSQVAQNVTHIIWKIFSKLFKWHYVPHPSCDRFVSPWLVLQFRSNTAVVASDGMDKKWIVVYKSQVATIFSLFLSAPKYFVIFNSTHVARRHTYTHMYKWWQTHWHSLSYCSIYLDPNFVTFAVHSSLQLTFFFSFPFFSALDFLLCFNVGRRWFAFWSNQSTNRRIYGEMNKWTDEEQIRNNSVRINK